MNEKLTDRIGLLSLLFTTLLFLAEVVCVSLGMNIIILAILFLAYNICAATFIILFVNQKDKKKNVLNKIKSIIMLDLILLTVCSIAALIRMLIL